MPTSWKERPDVAHGRTPAELLQQFGPRHLHVPDQSSNNDNVWNSEEATLRITIDPPFYKTWWAYLLYFSIITFIIVKIIRHQHDKHERERELRYKQMEQDKVNELHEERMRMFTNFSHELRTPLTLIINPLNDLMQYVSFSPEIKETLQLIKKNTGRMLLLVNNLNGYTKIRGR